MKNIQKYISAMTGFLSVLVVFLLQAPAFCGDSAQIISPLKTSVVSEEDLQRAAPLLPREYLAKSSREEVSLPPLPNPGQAGTVFSDPAFKSRLVRATQGESDGACQSFFTPSSSWQNTWNNNSTLFYVKAQSSFYLPFKFDPATLAVSAITDPKSKTQLALKFRHDPNFSYRDPAVIYGMSLDLQLQEYNFLKNTYTAILDLKPLVPTLEGEDTDGVSSSENDELVVAFNGFAQDRLRNVVWYDRKTGHIHLLDAIAGLVDNEPAGFSGGKGVHHASIDKGGRYVNVVIQGLGLVVWDAQTGACSIISEKAGAHGAAAYGYWINHQTISEKTGQGWMERTLDPEGVLSPKPVLSDTPHFWGDSHPSWNNARHNVKVPFLTAVYNNNYQPGDTKLEPLMGEIIAVSTDGSGKLWRFAHHRSVVNKGTTLNGGLDFWSTPRGNVSQDGRFFLFDSNWEDTLGKDPHDGFRKDVFVVELFK